jgi:predicted N-acetyltransferase YhbS
MEPAVASAAVLSAAIAPEAPGDAAEVMALVERVFGPGRYAKAAERLREGNAFIPALSFTAREDGHLVGTVRLWPIRVGENEALLLGPIAVDPNARNKGVGATLVERACEAATRAGHAALLLVGDMPYFARMGFEALEPGRLVLPGPADPRRTLVKALKPGALEGLDGQVSLP